MGLDTAEAAVHCISKGIPQRYNLQWKIHTIKYWLLTDGLLLLRRFSLSRKLIVPAMNRLPWAFSRIIESQVELSILKSPRILNVLVQIHSISPCRIHHPLSLHCGWHWAYWTHSSGSEISVPPKSFTSTSKHIEVHHCKDHKLNQRFDQGTYFTHAERKCQIQITYQSPFHNPMSPTSTIPESAPEI